MIFYGVKSEKKEILFLLFYKYFHIKIFNNYSFNLFFNLKNYRLIES